MEHADPQTRDGDYDYVLFSDVHLGGDLVTHVRPWAASWLERESELDARLVAMLAHQRSELARGRRLRVVIAGDFLELVGISLPPTSVRTRPTREERMYGLGSASDHVVAKVQAIAGRHPRVFRALMELVRDGHELVLVRGNHDIELHWYAARHALVDAIVAHAAEAERAALRARISLHAWFYLVPGLLYVEHGHHFDVMCHYGDPLQPTCPKDSRRIRQVPFSVMLRNVARPTRGLSTASYEHVGFAAYLRLLVKLGFTGSVRIAVRFARASLRLLYEWTSYARGERRKRRHAASVRKLRFAARTQVSSAQLGALEALHARPAACSLRFVLRSLFLDRVLALSLAVAGVVLGAILAGTRELSEGLALAPLSLACAAFACVGSPRDIVPTERMLRGARSVAELFGVRWVAMGHTHVASVHELADGARYVNLGHWGEDDLPEERASTQRSPCTYLHLARGPEGYRGVLMRWDALEGPVRAPLEAEQPATIERPREPLLPRMV